MPLTALLVSTLAVAVAEIGDKTQLLALVLAARYRKPWPIVAGIFVATVANHALAGWLGALASQWISPELARWLIAASFLAVALWALVPDTLDEGEAKAPRFGAFLATLVAFFLVEIGDKTQIATVVLAAQYQPLWQVVLGTTLGMLLANVPVVLLGARFAHRLPLKAARWASAVLFAALAVWVVLRPTSAAAPGDTPPATPVDRPAAMIGGRAGIAQSAVESSEAVSQQPAAGFRPTTGTAAVASKPLPPANSPLLDILPELEARLAVGDGRAGCRLARELRRCHRVRFEDPTTHYLIDAAASLEADDPLAENMARAAAQQ